MVQENDPEVQSKLKNMFSKIQKEQSVLLKELSEKNELIKSLQEQLQESHSIEKALRLQLKQNKN